MLVQFMLKNVLSFKDETILDMTAINAYKEHPMNLIECDNKEKILKVAAIYGANASGKSNLHLGMRYFQEIVAKSFNNVKDGEETVIARYFCPFSFDENEENSEFEMIQIRNGFEYKYGFEYNAECIVTEWLYRKSLKTNRTMTIFERTTESTNLGAAVRKECDVYKEQIPEETLALSFFNKLKLKTDIFQETYEGVMDTLVVQTDFCEDVNILDNFLPDTIDDEKEKLLQFLSAIDTGIKDIKYEDNDKEIYFLTFHKGKNGKEYPLNLFNESEGTIKSIMLFIYARAAIGGDGAMFVDELNVKLHPLLLKFIIDLFYNSDSKAQLIYTTHDTTLMDKKFFRRDQIWFVQKDEYGYSELSALSDFKVRSDASFEKDYLAGVYGGIPLLKEFKIEEKLYEELVQETKQVILENDFEHISEGLALSTNFKKLEIKFSVDGLGTWSSQRIDVKELKKYKNLFKFLNNTQAIEFIKFVKKNGVEDSIEYGFGDLDTVCNLPHRDDGRKLCKTLRNIRKEFSKLNGIDFEFMDCSNISEICAGTCEVCDYEAEQINRRVKKLKNVKYLEFKVD